VSKVAALGALVVLVRALGSVDDTTLLAVALLAALSMTVGNLVALVQTDAVRLLAWSTVAQAGWVLLPLASLSSRAAAAAGSYLLVYVTATLLAFVVVVVVAHDGGGTSLEGQRGLVRARPLLALPLGLALLTLAGLPPAVVGLVAKVVALRPVVGDGTWWLALVAAVNVAVGIAVYLRWFAMLLDARAAPAPAAPAPASGAEASGAEEVHAADDAGTGPEPPDATGTVTAAGAARHTPAAWWVLVAVLTALLVLGSLAPVGIV
jgi:NADH-quinone oxidoreductase subunit N